MTATGGAGTERHGRAPAILARVGAASVSVAAWVREKPGTAWAVALLLVISLAATESSYWPRNNYPGATWHVKPRGEDIELGQANAAKAGWPELLGYWTGPMLQSYTYYRPLSSWLFVAEYRLFGTNDRQWAILNFILHLAVVGMLVYAVSVWMPGALPRRLGTGVLAGLLLSAPGLADRGVQSWMIGWWPCQPEMLALLCGLLLLTEVARYAREGGRRWIVLALVMFPLAVFFKEMGYAAGIGACVLLVRRRESWPLLAGLAAEGLVLFGLRAWALGTSGGFISGREDRFHRMLQTLCPALLRLGSGVLPFLIGLIALLLFAAWLMRRRCSAWERTVVAAVLYFAVGSVAFGLPWDSHFRNANANLAEAASYLLIAGGVILALRRWPLPELVIIWILSAWVVVGFPPIFGWYRYWVTAFGSVLTAVALVMLLEYGWARMTVKQNGQRNQPAIP